MGMLSSWLGGNEAGEDMARASSRPLDSAKIEALAQKLRLTVNDAAAFKQVLLAVESDASMNVQEIVAIAHQFVGGLKPKSRLAALTAISQERVRVAHAKSKAASAAKAKAW